MSIPTGNRAQGRLTFTFGTEANERDTAMIRSQVITLRGEEQNVTTVRERADEASLTWGEKVY